MKKTLTELAFEKLMELPEQARESAIREYKIQEYFNRAASRHEVLLRDTPHPAMKLDSDGNWAGVVDRVRSPRERARKII